MTITTGLIRQIDHIINNHNVNCDHLYLWNEAHTQTTIVQNRENIELLLYSKSRDETSQKYIRLNPEPDKYFLNQN